MREASHRLIGGSPLLGAMHLRIRATKPTTTTALGPIFDGAGVSLSERAVAATRSDLRSDLSHRYTLKTLRGWANRANRSTAPVLDYGGEMGDLDHANLTTLALEKTGYARSTYTEGRLYGGVRDEEVVTRTTDRQATQTEQVVTEKAAEACPTDGCSGYLHPVTMECNGGKRQASVEGVVRCCGGYFPEGGEQAIRTDVVNRYEQIIKGIAVLDFDAATVTARTIKQRGGADKARQNPEKWSIYARWVRGMKPTWRVFRFGVIVVQDSKGERGFMTVAYPADQEAQAAAAGINIRGAGPNLFNREAAL